MKRFWKTHPRWRDLGLAALAGAGIGLGQVPVSLWPLALVALAGMLWLARATGRAGWIGFAGGFGHTLVAMYWITDPFLVEPEIHGWMAPFALALMAAGFGLFWAVPMALAARLRGGAAVQLVLLALALALSDLLRSYAFTGFPWVLFGHVWIETPVAQLASVTGQHGLGLLTLMLGAVLALRRALPIAVAALVLAGLWFDPAGWLQGRALDDQAEAPLVRLVQPNAAQHLKWLPEYRMMFFERLLDLSAPDPAPDIAPVVQEVPGRRPDLVIWPETSVPFLLDRAGDGLAMIADALDGTPLAFGIQRSQELRYYNSLAVMDGQGAIVDLYDKVHLVPFGEYIPFGDQLARFGIGAFAAQQGNGYTAGVGEQVLDLGPLGQVQPLICYEAVFPQDIRRAPTRPGWILQVTNDAWFGTLAGPQQHLSLSRLRAIEFGLPVARVANTGISAMIDAHGRITAQIPMGEMGARDVTVPPALAPTPYARRGDAPMALLILALFAAFSLLARYGIDHRPARG